MGDGRDLGLWPGRSVLRFAPSVAFGPWGLRPKATEGTKRSGRVLQGAETDALRHLSGAQSRRLMQLSARGR